MAHSWLLTPTLAALLLPWPHVETADPRKYPQTQPNCYPNCPNLNPNPNPNPNFKHFLTLISFLTLTLTAELVSYFCGYSVHTAEHCFPCLITLISLVTLTATLTERRRAIPTGATLAVPTALP